MMLQAKQGWVVAGVLASMGACGVRADEADLKKAIERAYPKVQVHSVTKTPFKGLYEIYVDGQIFYADEKFTFMLVDGRLIDIRSKRDLTTERMEDLSRVDFGSLPLELAIKVVRGNGTRKLVIFSDPDCPYCKRLEQQELFGMNDVTIYTFLYPLEGLHPDASRKAAAIWCAPDRAQAWQDWILNGALPRKIASCDTPLIKVAELASKLGISSTPTLIFADGKRLSGAYPAKDIEKAMAAAIKK